jgi:hypothetical protein
MRKTPLATLLAVGALTAAGIAPAGAGALPGLLVQPNPAAPGETVEVTPLMACFEGATGARVEVTGPAEATFTPALVEEDGRYDWRVEFPAGAAGVYTVDAVCIYGGGEESAYAPATLVVEGDPVPTSSSTTAAPGSTSTTTAASTTTTTAARPTAAAAVTARPAYTG